jgi:hypothetical protein
VNADGKMVLDGKLYLREQGVTLCYDLRSASTAAASGGR